LDVRQGEQERYRGDEATHPKGASNLQALQRGIDVGVFYHPQLIVDHSAMPAFFVGCQMIDDLLEQWPAKAFVAVDGLQFCPFLFRLVLNLIALGRDALVQDLLGRPCGKMPPRAIEIPPAIISPSTTRSNHAGATSLTAMINTSVVTRPTLSSKHNLTEPITPMRMLLVDLRSLCSPPDVILPH
jgi:hypothetical protein